jgi:hypothetical protein
VPADARGPLADRLREWARRIEDAHHYKARPHGLDVVCSEMLTEAERLDPGGGRIGRRP